jgi:hypothetical protein
VSWAKSRTVVYEGGSVGSVEDIIITHRAEDGTFSKVDYGKDGQLYNMDGSLYEGDNKFFIDAKNALNDARSADGRIGLVIDVLEYAGETHTITNENVVGASGAGSYTVRSKAPGNKNGSVIVFDPDGDRSAKEFAQVSDGAILTNELKHSFNIQKGIRDFSKTSSGVAKEEVDSVNFQNLYHNGKREPLRTNHAGKDISSDLIPPYLYWNF